MLYCQNSSRRADGGIIGRSSAYPGDFVAPSKKAFAKIVQSDPIRVTFPIPDRDYYRLRREVKSAAGGTVPFFGMFASTCLGILLVPGLYALFQTLCEKVKKVPPPYVPMGASEM